MFRRTAMTAKRALWAKPKKPCEAVRPRRPLFRSISSIFRSESALKVLPLKRLFAQREHDLRESYARWVNRILCAQLLVADAVFIAFAWAGSHWVIDPGVIEVWLGATVVQVVGIVLIVTRHLFSNRDHGPVGI
jgi:hypothetical protein